MPTLNDVKIAKSYYRIREVSEQLALPLSTLRYWETQFPELCPKRNAKGTRYYTAADIELLQQIKFLLYDRGLKIEAAKETMRTQSSTIAAHRKAVDGLRKIRATLVGLRDALNRLR